MDSRQPIDRLVGLLALIALAAVALALAGVAAAVDPPAQGDWVVDDATVISMRDITLRGNLTVTGTGSLTLTGCNLELDMPASGAYHIEVRSGGTLVLDGTAVDSADGSGLYNMTISGSATIGDSVIRRLDGPSVPNPLTPARGLVIQSSQVRLHNTTVERSTGYAISVVPAALSSTTPLIEDCIVRNNDGGLYCGGLLLVAGNPTVRNTHFYAHSLSDVAVIASEPTIEGCTFGYILGWSTAGVVVTGLAEPRIVGCTFNYILGTGIASLLADPTVEGCTVTGCLANGIIVMGGDATITDCEVSNCALPIVLNNTGALVEGCEVSGLGTILYAVSIDAGDPVVRGLTVDIMVGGGIGIVNGSQAVVEDSTISAGGGDCIYVEESSPTISGCLVEDGDHGIHLVSSQATVEDCEISNNPGWGIRALHVAPTLTSNTFGTGSDENGLGQIVQLYDLSVSVELESGDPAEGALVVLEYASGEEAANVTTDASGLAYDELTPEYEVNNRGVRIDYSPFTAHASLDDLYNDTTFDLDADLDVVLVLRPDLPPLASITQPADGAVLNAWDHPNGIRVEGTGSDPEGGDVDMEWWLNGVQQPIGGVMTGFTFFPTPGEYNVTLRVTDDRGNWVNVSVVFTVVSVPPATNGVTIVLPADGAEHMVETDVEFRVEWTIQDHPYGRGAGTFEVSWTSSLDGDLGLDVNGSLDTLSVGTHVINVSVATAHPEWIPDPYTDSVTVTVVAPEPVAFANISSPEDGVEVAHDAAVTLSGEGSYVDVYAPPDMSVVYRWSSSLDGNLGSGMELVVRGLSVGFHVITLEVTTVPLIVSDNATVSVTVLPPPNEPPTATAASLTEVARVNETVNLSAEGSSDPDGDELSYTWDFGDGGSGTGALASHVYSADGNFTVTLTVSDGEAEATATLVVEVLPALPDDGNGNGNGNGNGDGNGDGDDGDVSTQDPVYGWLLVILIIVALVVLSYMAVRGRSTG